MSSGENQTNTAMYARMASARMPRAARSLMGRELLQRDLDTRKCPITPQQGQRGVDRRRNGRSGDGNTQGLRDLTEAGLQFGGQVIQRGVNGCSRPLGERGETLANLLE